MTPKFYRIYSLMNLLGVSALVGIGAAFALDVQSGARMAILIISGLTTGFALALVLYPPKSKTGGVNDYT